jgi:hypothetical protein
MNLSLLVLSQLDNVAKLNVEVVENLVYFRGAYAGNETSII